MLRSRMAAKESGPDWFAAALTLPEANGITVLSEESRPQVMHCGRLCTIQSDLIGCQLVSC